MVMFDNGSGPLARPIAADVTRFTPGKIVPATGKAVPCSVDGEVCDGIFNDTVKYLVNGTGVGLLAPWDGGGLGIAALAFGPVEPGENLIVKISATDGLPKFASATEEGAPGDKIVGIAALGSSATAEDVANADGVLHPSLAVRLIPPAAGLIVGGETTDTYEDFQIDLAGVVDGDVVTDFVPGFAFEIVSDKFVVTSPVTTAGKATTFHLEINAVVVTGGVIALTSANATPDGKVISGTPVTANNTGSATDAISIVAAATTAFVEGAGTFKIRLRHAA
jgi:hypothetical protein